MCMNCIKFRNSPWIRAKFSKWHTRSFFCSEINLEDVLDCYGYKNLEQVKTEYGDDWEAILAECQFELNAGCLENLITQEFLTYDEAKQLICRVSGYEG